MKYALIIGNNKYDDPKLAQLKTPAADTQALAAVLTDKNIGSFDEVTPLVNKTEPEVRRAISAFLLNKKPEDLVLVYFSGHGVLDDRGRLFLSLKDTQTDLLQATAIPSAFVSDAMDGCRSKRQVLILDCCHSGAFARGTKGQQSPVTEATFEGNGYGRVVMTASDSLQYALEGNQVIKEAELSLFTYFLLEGLKTGDADEDNDGQVALNEWYDYAYSKVVSQTPMQIPHKWSYNQQGDLVIARNPNIKKRVAELPSEILQAVESPFPSTRESGVVELGKLLRSRNVALVNVARQRLEQMKGDDSRRIASAAEALLAERASSSALTGAATDKLEEDLVMKSEAAPQRKPPVKTSKASTPVEFSKARLNPKPDAIVKKKLKLEGEASTGGSLNSASSGARQSAFLILLEIALVLSAVYSVIFGANISNLLQLSVTLYGLAAIAAAAAFFVMKNKPKNISFVLLAIFLLLDGTNSVASSWITDFPLYLFSLTGIVALAAAAAFLLRWPSSRNIGFLLLSGYLLSVSLSYFGIANVSIYGILIIISALLALPATIFLFLEK